ncbi:hypothetical protein D3C72_535440 [compost metagenome]
MARNKAEIKLTLTSAFIVRPEIKSLYNLDPSLTFEQQFSATSFESVLFDVIANAVWILESLFDYHKKEVDSIVAQKRGPYIPFYIQAAKDFQYGYSLPDGKLEYDNTGLDEAAILASKRVKYAAATGVSKGVRVKVAAEDNGDLVPLDSPVLEAFKHYMERVTPPGINLYLVNEPADLLQLDLTIYYDPLVINASGQRIDGTDNSSVENAINTFLKNQPFDGLFVLARLVDALQQVPGVEIPSLNSAQVKYGSLPYMPVNVTYLPRAGYLKIDNLVISYQPQSPII